MVSESLINWFPISSGNATEKYLFDLELKVFKKCIKKNDVLEVFINFEIKM